MRLSHVVTLGCALLLEGCCHEIGCFTTVNFQLGASLEEFVVDEPVEVRACLDQDCVVETLTRRADSVIVDEGGALSLQVNAANLQLRPPGGLTDGTHTLTLELTRGGNVVLSATQEAKTRTFTPNGAFCPPVCRSTGITL